jgi:hypothetical protein
VYLFVPEFMSKYTMHESGILVIIVIKSYAYFNIDLLFITSISFEHVHAWCIHLVVVWLVREGKDGR